MIQFLRQFDFLLTFLPKNKDLEIPPVFSFEKIVLLNDIFMYQL